MDDVYYLGQLSEETPLIEQIVQLHNDDIMAMAEEHIADRGYDYYRSGYVKKWVEKVNEIVVSVQGSYGNNYEIVLFEESLDLMATCSCPYDDTCKHIIASLLHIRNDTRDKMIAEDDKKEKVVFLDQLNKMTKQELMTLVDRFASVNYRKSIVIQQLPEHDVALSLKKIQSSIQHTLRSDNFMYDPEGLSNVAMDYLSELSAHSNIVPSETFDIVLWFAKEIEKLEDEGYLYQESCSSWYDGDAFFDYENFSNAMIEMLGKIDEPTIQAEMVLKSVKFCNGSNHFYFDYSLLLLKDKKLLIFALDELEDLEFYNYVKDVVPYEQQISYLKKFETGTVTSEIVDAYVKHGERTNAIDFIKSLLMKKFDLDNALLMLELVPVHKMEKSYLYTLVEEAIKSHDYRAYAFIESYIQKCDNVANLEKILKKYKIHWYYTYLDKYNRVEEMHTVLNKVSHEKAKFYKKYKQRYKEEAITFYKSCINENLPFTGNQYYDQITSDLKELRPLISKEEFTTIVSKLKIDFKRRRNFIQRLNEKF